MIDRTNNSHRSVASQVLLQANFLDLIDLCLDNQVSVNQHTVHQRTQSALKSRFGADSQYLLLTKLNGGDCDATE